MPNQARQRFIGATGSPYTRKMLALMRYRRIPYTIIWGEPALLLDEMGIAKPRPTFHPTFLFDKADGSVEAQCDSTPIIRRLEETHPDRSVIPNDPALAFINYLIEDFGDEWCTKYMFHYRWYFEEDIDVASTLLPFTMDISLSAENHSQFKRMFAQRQVERLYVIGSNDVTAPVIDASYRRYLAAMNKVLERQPFTLGARPGSGDYAMFGQLTQLVGLDPTPRAIAHEISPRTVSWLTLMEDLCGLEPEEAHWADIDSLGESLGDLLSEIGRVYAPALLANAAALETGQETWETEIDGARWTQNTFPYQGKCLGWIREKYQGLDGDARGKVDALLAGTGCETLIKP